MQIVNRVMQWLNQHKIVLIEYVILLSGWYYFIGYLTFSDAIPWGVEYPRNMHSLFAWEAFLRCGACMFWANTAGGYPTFADVYGGFLHPIAMVSSLLFGAIQGSKMTIVLAFLLIGITTWWLGHLLSLHPVARLWGALASMYGGHIACRLEVGSIGLPLSLAAGWLAIVSLYSFMQHPSRMRAVLAGVAVGTLLLAGQGYYQVGFILFMPILLLLAYRMNLFALPRAELWQYGGAFALVAVGVAAPFLYSFVAYGQYFDKDRDMSLYSTMSVIKLMLNWLNSDVEMAYSATYNVVPFPYLYSTYIGYATVILAILGIVVVREKYLMRMYDFFALLVLFVYMIASGDILRLLMSLNIDAINNAISTLRYVVVLNGYGTLGIIIMAMLSLHYLLTVRVLIQFAWHYRNLKNRVLLRVRLSVRQERWLSYTLNSVIALGLLWNLSGMYRFNSTWIRPAFLYEKSLQDFVDSFERIPRNQLVDVGGDWLQMQIMHAGYKIYNPHLSWWFGQREGINYKYAFLESIPENFSLLYTSDNVWFMSVNEDVTANYALLTHTDGTVLPCDATAYAGTVSVTCTSTQPGHVRIFEHAMTGWYVWLDGQRVTPTDDPWMTVALSAGTHKLEYRFLPISTILGIVHACVTWLGVLAFCIWEWWRQRRTTVLAQIPIAEV